VLVLHVTTAAWVEAISSAADRLTGHKAVLSDVREFSEPHLEHITILSLVECTAA
jgi:hypothetical protein